MQKVIKKFKELGVKPAPQGLEGDKIRIERILNREVIINGFNIVPSKYPEKYEWCLHLQITIDNIKYVVFSGSKVLIGILQQISKEDFPFATTIIKANQRFEFT